MGYGIRIGAVPSASKPYTAKAVGGLFGGKTKGPYSASELVALYREHGSKLGGLFVKSVEVYRNGKLFFVCPRDGGPAEFAAKDAKASAPVVREEVDVVEPDIEPADVPKSGKTKAVLAGAAGLALLLFLRR